MATSSDPRFPHGFPAQAQPASSKKGWLLGGCGCLGLIALVCIGGSLFVYFTWFKPFVDFTAEAITMATESPQVKEVLGEPVTSIPDGIQSEVAGNSFKLRIPVRGSKGQGVVVAEGIISPSWAVEPGSMQLEFDGQTIDLDPDAATPEPDIVIGDD